MTTVCKLRTRLDFTPINASRKGADLFQSLAGVFASSLCRQWKKPSRSFLSKMQQYRPSRYWTQRQELRFL